MSNLSPLLTVGVVSDTHIPDRALALPEELLDGLRSLKVDLILHAGDISVSSVIDTLEQIAPVKAVRGNRDFLLMKKLPLVRRMNLAGNAVLLTHGHGNWFHYLVDKVRNVKEGYSIHRYRPLLDRLYPNARVVVFGHTHFPENRLIDGKLLFNPGSSTMEFQGQKPSFGVLRFYPNGNVMGEIIHLRRIFS